MSANVSDLYICIYLFASDNSLTEQLDSTETHSSGDDIELSADAATDQSEAFIGGERKAAGVAEAALQDGEKQSNASASLLQAVGC